MAVVGKVLLLFLAVSLSFVETNEPKDSKCCLKVDPDSKQIVDNEGTIILVVLTIDVHVKSLLRSVGRAY